MGTQCQAQPANTKQNLPATICVRIDVVWDYRSRSVSRPLDRDRKLNAPVITVRVEVSVVVTPVGDA